MKRIHITLICLILVFILCISCDLIELLFPNTPPVADAGPDQTVSIGDTVYLDGSNSYDSDGNSLAYKWFPYDAPEATESSIYAIRTAKPYFTPDVVGDYVFFLVVSDRKEDSKPDKVVIHAN